MYKFLEENSYIVIALCAVFALIYVTKIQRKIEHFAFLKKAWRGVKRGVSKGARAVSRGVKNVANKIKNAVKRAVDRVKREFKKVIDNIRKTAMRVINSFKGIIKRVGETFKQLWGHIKSLPKHFSNFVGTTMGTIASTFGSLLWGIMEKIFTFIAKLTKELVHKITKPLKNHIIFVSGAFLLFFCACGGAAYLIYSKMPQDPEVSIENNNVVAETNIPITNQPVA
jgi:phage-related protein